MQREEIEMGIDTMLAYRVDIERSGEHLADLDVFDYAIDLMQKEEKMLDRIEFKIPFGTIAVNLEAFFGEAKKSQIRGMLKLLRDSWLPPQLVKKLKEWLQARIDEEKDHRKQAAGNCLTARSELAEREEDYRRMQSPCYAVFTRDKDRLKQARERIARDKARCRQSENELKRAQRQERRYRECLEDVAAILEGGPR